jgi:mannose-6-phosphate isomerase-like protein (cupin superfamily)
MNLNFPATANKDEVFAAVRQYLTEHKFNIINEEYRPWGGFFVIDEEQAAQFAHHFFEGDERATVDDESNKLSPKILIVEAGSRLSWQYHDRRSEIWKVIGEACGIITSMTNKQGKLQVIPTDHIVTLRQGERHRLIGLSAWGIIAEIWQHTDKEHPSDESDIVRLDDDFGR